MIDSGRYDCYCSHYITGVERYHFDLLFKRPGLIFNTYFHYRCALFG